MLGQDEQDAYADELAADMQPQREVDIPRYPSVRCGDCGRGLTWIEIAFGRVADPVCGKCLKTRKE